ncbi:MAG: phytoene desaturase family protein [Candidatus Omnitrophota bacterium]
MSKKINIIGAGMTGLCVGSYLQMNGYDTEIFEMHTLPGGLCTSWERHGYTFEGCLHWLVGSNPSDSMYRHWNELIDMRQLTFIDHNEYMRIEGENGAFISIKTDIDELEKEMLSKCPEDKDIILTFASGVRKLIKMEIPNEKAPDVSNWFDFFKLMVKILPYWGTINKWMKESAGDLAAKCKNPLAKRTFTYMFEPHMPVFFLIMVMVFMNKKNAGYPIGGSLKFSRLFEKRYLELGGKIHYHSKVEKILTQNHRAVGIVLENGETRNADITISTADGHFTLFDMLEGKFTDNVTRHYYDHYQTFPSLLYVSAGIKRTFPGMPHSLIFPLDTPLTIDPETTLNDMWSHIYNYDPTLAPEGKTVMMSLIPTYNYKYWVDLRQNDKARYSAEKERIGNAVMDIMEAKYGNIRSNIEVLDVATPATLIRYTNNWKGSFEGWLLTPEIGLKQMKKTLPGLKNFYMAGQWTSPGGGLPSCLQASRGLAQLICKRDKQKFVTLSH